MVGPERNQPCPCGSGKKYKKCCLAKVEADRHSASLARMAHEAAELDKRHATMEAQAGVDRYRGNLEEDSNAVIDLIDAGKLDEAELAARHLLENYPDVHDGYDRLGMICQARGDIPLAIDWYRKTLAFIRQNIDRYDPEFAETYQQLITRLQAALPPPSAVG
jgi:tetratricopeptide (TPR) repeat protein